MKAIRYATLGGPEVLRYEELPLPEPGSGEIRIKTSYIGVNYVDVYHRSGQFPAPLPMIPGEEAAGIVDALGPGVSEVRLGDRVAFVDSWGAYAEYVVIPAWLAIPVPDSLELRLAAAVIFQGLTAHYLSHSAYRIRPGDTVLIHAAAGGVGQLLVQMAKRQGATVFGTVSTAEKARRIRQLGADAAILYNEVDFEAEVKRLTAGQGADAVYDSVGQHTFEKSLNSLKLRGTLVLYGQASGATPPLDPRLLAKQGSLFLTWPILSHHIRDRAELLQRARDVFNWLLEGQLQVQIDQQLPLHEAASAHRYLEARRSRGKLLLVP